MNLALVEDLPIDKADVKKAAKKLNIKVIEINPKNFNDLIFQAFFKDFDGILIDINLSQFEFQPEFDKSFVTIGSSDFSNGIDVAKQLSKYNRHIPIGIYSNHLEDHEGQLSKLDKRIPKYSKQNQDFEIILKSFREYCKNFNRRVNCNPPLPSYHEFSELSIRKKDYFFKRVLSKINPTKYFEVVGDYLWFLKCGDVLKEFHGPVESPLKLNKEQEKIKKDYQLKIFRDFENFKDSDLFKLAQQNQHLPIFFWNLRVEQTLRANIIFYSQEVNKGLLESESMMFNIQAAKGLIDFYLDDVTKNLEKTQRLLSKLFAKGRFEFQKLLLLENQELIYQKEKTIEEVSTPFAAYFEEKILAIFRATVVSQNEKNNVLGADLLPLFEDAMPISKDFNLKFMKEEYFIEHIDQEFYFISFLHHSGSVTKTIEHIF